MKNMKISYVIAVYNASDLADKCIHSILDVMLHSGASFEILLIDGGSQDGIERIANKYSERISVYISESEKTSKVRPTQ